jgi:hypothetical protein
MTEEIKTTVVVAGKEYELVKKGLEQAQQVIDFGSWVSEYGLGPLQDMSEIEGNVSNEQMLSKLFSSLTPDALIELFSVIIGCPKTVSKKEFDIGTLIDGILIVWDNQPGIRSVVQRFFSTQSS